MKKLLIIPLVLLLSGCMASLGPSKEFYMAQLELAKAKLEQAKQPTVKLTCTQGCQAEYFDPRAMDKIGQIDEGTTAGKTLDNLGGKAVTALGIYTGGRVVKSVLGTLGQTIINGDGNQIDQNNDPTTITQNEAGGNLGDTLSGNANNNGNIGDQRGDEYVGDQNNNAGRLDSPDDYTHEPTITAPEVVVTPPPEVVIVDQPPVSDPVIITPTDQFEVQ